MAKCGKSIGKKSIAQLLDCIASHRSVRSLPLGGFRWVQRTGINTVSVNKAELCYEKSNQQGKSKKQALFFKERTPKNVFILTKKHLILGRFFFGSLS